MKTKILGTALIGCLLITAIFSGGAAYAQEETLTDPGITPDSPFYFMDKIGKALGMFFAFGDEAKVKKALKYGEERLAEAEAMAGEDLIEEMEAAAEGYEGYMATVQERLENGGVSDNITERVCMAASRHLAAMERIRERTQGRTGDTIASAENATVNGQICALRALSRNRLRRAAELTADAIERQMERYRARVRVSDNVTSDNVTNTSTALDYAERIAALEDELLAKAEEMGFDGTPVLERLAQSTSNRLNVLSDVWKNAPETARPGIENAIENSVRKYERANERLRARNAWSANETEQNMFRFNAEEEDGNDKSHGRE